MENSHCAVCDKDVFGDPNLLDFYELTRTYAELEAGKVLAAPDPITELTFLQCEVSLCLCRSENRAKLRSE
jgi:hypothetical protein